MTALEEVIAVVENVITGGSTKEDLQAALDAAKAILKPLANNDKIVVLIKIDRDAKFNNMVSIIDQLDIAHLDRFSILELDAKDKAEVEKL